MHRRRTRPYAAVVVAAALTSACAAGSTSAADVGAPPSQAPTSAPSATSAATSAATVTATSAGGSAALDYTPPAGNPGPQVHKTVTGATYQRLATDLAALKPVPVGNATCNVLTGETATITMTSPGHTRVFTVDGSPCRGVQLTTDGVPQPLLGGSITLLTQVRAIAGTSGLAHPLGAG